MSARLPLPGRDRAIIMLSTAAALTMSTQALAQSAACPFAITALTLEGAHYDPLGDGFSGTITAQIESRTDGNCEADLRLTDHSGASLRALELPGFTMPLRLELLTTPGVLALTDPATAKLLLKAGADPVTVRWVANAQSNQLLPPGDYAMEVTARSGDTAMTSQLAFASPARAQANFAGGSLDQTIDLGILQPGKRGRAVLQVRANTRPIIAMVSANRGYLSLVGVPGASVPYSLSLDGNPVDLRGEWRQPVNIPTNQQGQSLQIEVTIGDFANALAGTYRDDVTIEISP